jgi:hypothetical protein
MHHRGERIRERMSAADIYLVRVNLVWWWQQLYADGIEVLKKNQTSRHRMIWLLPSPPPTSVSCLSLCVAAPSMELTDGSGVGGGGEGGAR